MVDINLLGDEGYQNDSEEENDNFSDTYSSDSSELTSESHLSDSDLHSSPYDKSYTRNSSKKSFYVIGIIVSIAVIIIAYLLYNFSRENDTRTKPVNNDIVKSDELMIRDTQNEPPLDITETELPVFVRQMVTSTQNGINTVETILESIPQNVNFTMIQYQDGNFLAEVIGRSSSDISLLNSELQKSSSGQVKLLSQAQKNYQGGNYRQALLNGAFATSESAELRQPEYADVNGVKTDFQTICTSNGLQLKQFDVKKQYRSMDYTKTPVFFRAVGPKNAAVNFLADVKNKNMNVNLSKIVLIGSERPLNQDNVNVILNLEVYQPL